MCRRSTIERQGRPSATRQHGQRIDQRRIRRKDVLAVLHVRSTFCTDVVCLVQQLCTCNFGVSCTKNPSLSFHEKGCGGRAAGCRTTVTNTGLSEMTVHDSTILKAAMFHLVSQRQQVLLETEGNCLHLSSTSECRQMPDLNAGDPSRQCIPQDWKMRPCRPHYTQHLRNSDGQGRYSRVR